MRLTRRDTTYWISLMKTPRPDFHSYPKAGYAEPRRLALIPQSWIHTGILCGTLGSLALIYLILLFLVAR